jgi:hypothetical protein
MQEEFSFLKREKYIKGFVDFTMMLAPLSLVSVAGIALLFGAIALGWLQISYGMSLLIIVSSITLPHVFVMEKFYDTKEEN